MAINSRFPSNSNKSKAISEKPKTVPVVKGGVKTQEKSSIQKAKNNFFASDMKDVSHWVLTDVIGPGLKDLFVKTVTGGVTKLVYGEDARPGKKSGSSFNYSGISRGESTPTRIRTAYDYNDVLFDERDDAELVLEKMMDILESCGQVSIGDMYDLSGMQTRYTDFNYGWTRLGNASVERTRDGKWYIWLSRPEELNRR